MSIRKTRQLGGVLLVSGTTIGAGMLALPVLTGIAGFIPAMLLFLVYWAMSLCTALFLLEVNLWFKGPVNLITMSRYTLGKGGGMFAWGVYLLLLYSLTAAYLAGSGPMVAQLISHITGWQMPLWAEPLPFLFIFGTIIYFGTRPVDIVNRVLMLGLCVTYIVLIASSMGYIHWDLLARNQPIYLMASVPVVVTSFGFHIIIPSLVTYLDRNVKALKHSILYGSVIPLFVYLIWELVILGIVPVEKLAGALRLGQAATIPLGEMISSGWIQTSSTFFSFFAIVTSFLGVGLSLSHFLSDGFEIKQNTSGKMLTLILTFAIPLLFVLFYPRGFIVALEYAGIFVALLLGLLPILMVWRGRKVHKGDAPYKVDGGKPFLFIMLFSFILLFILIFKELS